MTESSRFEARVLPSNEPERLTLQCPACEKRMAAPVRLRGLTVDCPRCHANLFIPAASPVAEPAATGQNPGKPVSGAQIAPLRGASATPRRTQLSSEAYGAIAIAVGIGVLVVIAAIVETLDNVKGDWWPRVAEAIVGTVLLCVLGFVVALAVTLGVRIGWRVRR